MNKLYNSTNYIIYALAFVLVFFSTISRMWYKTGFYYDIGKFFHTGFMHRAFFSPFELIILLLLINIILNYQFNFKFSHGLVIFAFITYFFRMLNPNADPSNPVLGMPLFSNLGEYLLIFLLVVFLSLPSSLFLKIAEKLFVATVSLSIVRIFFLLIMFFSGQAQMIRWGSYAVIIDEPDTQLLFAFIGAICYALYLLSSRKKYLLASVLILGVTFLSGQRSTALPGLIAVFLISLFVFLKRLPTLAARSALIITIMFALLSVVVIQLPESKVSFAINRFIGATIQKQDADRVEFSDTGHREQSVQVFQSILSEKPFWGLGYGRSDEMYLEGQTSDIHNAYAGIWLRHDIITLLFYLFLVVVLIKESYSLLSLTTQRNFQTYLVSILASFYLFGYFFAIWFMPDTFLATFRMQLFYFMIILFVVHSNKVIHHT